MAGLILAAVAAFAVVALPTVSRSTVASADPNGRSVFTESRLPLLATEGWTVLIPVSIPVVVALVPVLGRHHRWVQRSREVSAALLAVGVVLAMASIGMFYLPLLAVLVAAALSGSGATSAARTGATSWRRSRH